MRKFSLIHLCVYGLMSPRGDEILIKQICFAVFRNVMLILSGNIYEVSKLIKMLQKKNKLMQLSSVACI